MTKSLNEVMQNIDQQVLLARPISEWLPMLADECQVYQLDGGGYIAKRFSQINYTFCDAKTAEEMLVNNLHAILRNKYFTILTDETLERIQSIIQKMTINLTSVLRTLTFNKDNLSTNSYLLYTQYIPDGCIAFRNGVYDFRNATWLFKYDKIELTTGLTLVSYPTKYMIKWYFNFDFKPLDFSLHEINLVDFIKVLKDLNDVQRNYCFELVYNIAHDIEHKFSINRFEHLCQILGYCCLNSFAQYFVMLIGAGQNGKNSLFDGCFTNRIVPKPSAIDLESIENNTFISGALEGVSHNIFLETSAKVYRESRMIKAFTGSQDQTIEHKGVGRYSGIINCKFVFAGNDKSEIKFADTTTGFTRRINMLEIYYTWDKSKTFLSLGDYYDASFSSDLHELKDDVLSNTIFVYLAMYGIKSATNNFTTTFNFTHNEWSTDYADVNHELKRQLENIKCSSLLEFCRKSDNNMQLGRNAFYDYSTRRSIIYSIVDNSNNKIFNSFKQLANSTEFVKELGEDVFIGENYIENLNKIYISIPFLKAYLGIDYSQHMFTKNLQKIYGANSISRIGANVACVCCEFNKGKLQILK